MLHTVKCWAMQNYNKIKNLVNGDTFGLSFASMNTFRHYSTLLCHQPLASHNMYSSQFVEPHQAFKHCTTFVAARVERPMPMQESTQIIAIHNCNCMRERNCSWDSWFNLHLVELGVDFEAGCWSISGDLPAIGGGASAKDQKPGSRIRNEWGFLAIEEAAHSSKMPPSNSQSVWRMSPGILLFLLHLRWPYWQYYYLQQSQSQICQALQFQPVFM